jgi:thiol-disulfide isomerase/thioredoxin
MNVTCRLATLPIWLPALLLLPVLGCQDTASEPVVNSDTAVASSNDVDSGHTDNTDVDITLTVTDVHGFDDTIASLGGHVVLVDFWATWCHPCLAGFPHTVELYEEFHDRGLEVVSVSFDEADDHPTALAFLKKNGAVFTNLRSKHGFNSEIPFETEGALPVLRVYDAQGKLIVAFASGDPTGPPFTPDDVRRAVEQAIETLESAAPDNESAAPDSESAAPDGAAEADSDG